MFAFLVGALHGVGLCPVKSSTWRRARLADEVGFNAILERGGR